MIPKVVSKRRQDLIAAKNVSEFTVGESVSVETHILHPDSARKREDLLTCTVLEVLPASLLVIEGDGSLKNRTKRSIKKSDVAYRDTWRIGANPFDETEDTIRMVAFTLESILFGLDVFGDGSCSPEETYDINGTVVARCNWNPFVYDTTGKKHYYQRPLVWSTKDKQLLIESIYQGTSCGKILVRKRGFEELCRMEKLGERELAFIDIVDGKQRLAAIRDFILGEFPDLEGNYYGDLSAYSQHLLTDHQLFSYAEMPEDSKDEAVIRQFLKLNFTGVPQSQEHISFVKSLAGRV